jgi:hypothetical protein
MLLLGRYPLRRSEARVSHALASFPKYSTGFSGWTVSGLPAPTRRPLSPPSKMMALGFDRLCHRLANFGASLGGERYRAARLKFRRSLYSIDSFVASMTSSPAPI